VAYSQSQLQLTHVLARFYQQVGGKVTLATGGSTTTIIDTKLAADLEDGNIDDIFNGGVAIVVKDAGGAAAAPEGEFSRITDYVASTTTVTFSPAMTVAPASGDRVLIAPPDFPIYDVIEQINNALSMLGNIPRPDTSIASADNQTEYTLPVALKGRQLLNVEYQGITTDANDNRWQSIPNWRLVDAIPGTAGTIILPQLVSGRTVRLWYLGEHPRVEAYDDPISEYFDKELVHAAVMLAVLEWRNDADRAAGVAADEQLVALEQKAWQKFDRMLVKHPVTLPQRRIQGFPHWSAGSTLERAPESFL
jgi:hypothetical protein